MSRDVNTKAARTTVYAINKLDDAVARANVRRAKKGKPPMTRSKAIEVLAKSLKIRDLVEA